LIPDAGGTYVLPRLLGIARAMGLSLTAEPINAEQAAAWGLIWQCVTTISSPPRRASSRSASPQGPTRAFALIKQALYASSANTLEQQLALEASLQRQAGRSADFQEGVKAFLEKRPAKFSGR
jgi:2-(1,2-epoxy-1,2-dihydrophenyl)acetyl-CoA isomerase